MCVACAVLQPYKHRAANNSGTILPIIFIITGGLYSIVEIYKFSTGMVLLCIAVATLPHCVFYGYGEYSIYGLVEEMNALLGLLQTITIIPSVCV